MDGLHGAFPALDRDVLDALCGGDAAFLTELQGLFQEQLEEFIPLGETAGVREADFAQRAQFLAHRLRGSAGALGFRRLAQGLAELERSARAALETGEGFQELATPVQACVADCFSAREALAQYAQSLTER